MQLNQDNTEMLIVEGSFDLLSDTCPALNGIKLPLKKWVCSLEVLLDPLLSLEKETASVAQSAIHQLGLVAQLQPYLDRDNLATVVLCSG